MFFLKEKENVSVASFTKIYFYLVFCLNQLKYDKYKYLVLKMTFKRFQRSVIEAYNMVERRVS